MGVKIIKESASKKEVVNMLEELGDYIKLAVDIDRHILAGGGEYHADCEQKLLQDGSLQKNIWGADWHPDTGEVKFGALINIRPEQGNMGMEIEENALREKIEFIVRSLMESKADA